MSIISNDLKLISHNINRTNDVITSGILYDKDYIGMSNNSAVSYEIGTLKPNEKKEFNVMIFIGDNKEKNDLESVQAKIEELKKLDEEKELKSAKQYWKRYLKDHMVHSISDGTKYKDRIERIYKRTILLYPLLTNFVTGGVSAAMEIDESFSKCRKIFILLA